jgi:hypothetical protein
MTEIPRESLVVSAVIFVVPLTAMRKLNSHDFACLDYFKFIKYSGFALKEIKFLCECKEDIEKNWDKYQWIYARLSDEKSKELMQSLHKNSHFDTRNYKKIGV